MGHKKICLKCKRVENFSADLTNIRTGKCPECSNEMVVVNHSFRPPKKTDKKGWELAAFLISNGFVFQHVYQEGKSEYYKTPTDNYVSYPKNLEEAREFIEKYKDQSIRGSNPSN